MNSNNSIEFIIRCRQKDIEYSEHLLNKLLKFLDSFSHLFSINISLNNIEEFSKLIFNTVNYLLRKDKLSPGEEYTNISKEFKGGKFKLVSYVISASLQNYILKRIHSKLIEYFEVKSQGPLIRESMSSVKYYYLLIKNVMIKLYYEYSNFDNLLEKFEEMQFCLLFLEGTNYTFIQKIFGFGYFAKNKGSANHEQIISKSGFKFFGYLLLFKVLTQIYYLVKKIFYMLKDEKQKTIDNKYSTNILQNSEPKKFNVKLKYSEHTLNNSENKNKMCLLCLDIREGSSLTKCGHLFCWKCIIAYLQTNPQCPFCRLECNPQNVVYLKNYN
jgi:hypothetical protein